MANEIDSVKLLAVAAKLAAILGELSPEERRRTLSAVHAIIGDVAKPGDHEIIPEDAPAAESQVGVSESGRRWMKQNKITMDHLSEIFHLDGENATLILDGLSGKSDRADTIDAYLLAGIGALLATGEPDFTDKMGRAACSHLGCYDSPNHNKYTRQFGNAVIGNKETGWKLTGPGMKAAAEVIRKVSKQDDRA